MHTRRAPALAATLLAFATAAVAADPALERAAQAMRVNDLKSVRYTGDGIGWTFGQPFVPGDPWPRIVIESLTRSINYETGAMRDEIAFRRGEALGGGGYPHRATQRNDQYLHGNFAWNQVASAPLPGARFVVDRFHQLWITPYGAMRAALRNNAQPGTRTVDGKAMTTFTFTEPNRFRATVFVDGGRVVRVESRLPDPVLGETDAITTYGGYRDIGGFAFPTSIKQWQGGHPTLDLTVRDVTPNAPVDIALPDLVRAAAERVTAEKVADGVWFIAGGSHNSAAIEMKDYLILVEAPLNEMRTLPVLAEVKKLAPGKPIRYAINSHAHFDHSGGVRTAAGDGATIVTQARNKAFFEKTLATPSTIAPDHLAKSGRKARVESVGEKRTISDGTRTVELYRIGESHHTDSFLMVYLPKEKLLIQADGYTPGPPNAPPPAPGQANPNNVNLVENLERMNLKVERIMPLHGRVVPLAELYTAVGGKPPQ